MNAHNSNVPPVIRRASWARRDVLRTFGVGALALGTGVGLAGCASSDKPASPQSGASGVSGTPGAPSGKAVTTIRSTAVSWLWAPYLVAEEKGFFKDEGVNEKGNPTGRGEVANVVAAGEQDFLIGAPAGPMKTSLAGQPLKMFAGLVTTYASNVVVSDSAFKKAGLSAASSVDERAKALKGLRMATTGPGAGPDLLLRYIASKIADLNPNSDMKLVPVQGGGGSILAALKNGQVDGFCLSSPTSDQAVGTLGAHYLFNMADNPIPDLDNYLYIVMSTRPQTLTEKQSEILAYTKALQRSLNFIATKPDEFKAVMKGLFTGVDEQTFELGFKANLPIYAKKVEISQAQYKKALEFLGLALQAQGKDPAQANSLSFDDLVDTEIAKKAVAEIGNKN